MRSEGSHAKKTGSAIGFFAKFLLVIAIMVALFIGGFVLWVLYGEEGDGQADNAPQDNGNPTEVAKVVTVDISKDWSVPNGAFKGSNGYGAFVSKNVKNGVSRSDILSEMGIEENTKDAGEQKRIDALNMFLDGIYYEADKTDQLSNGDTIDVYIRSTEDPAEIEESAGIEIKGVGEHKKVTVAGLAEKFTYGELAGRKDLLDALVSTGKQKVREADEGHHKEIFGDEEKYDTELILYGLYFAQPQDKSCNDDIVLIYRIKSTYPDKNYVYWNKDGDLVFTYEMCHFDNINKDTTVDDIKKGVKYDAFRYQDKASEAFQWYKENLDSSTTYYLQQMSYSE